MLRNSNVSYGAVAKWMHWLVALCFLIAYVVIYYRIWFMDKEDALFRTSLQIHTAVGISVLVWASLRLVWKLTNSQPKPPAMPPLQEKASHWMHWILYFFMFAMPISGWFGYGGPINFELFQLPTFRDTGLGQWLLEFFNTDWDTWEGKWDFFHKEVSGAWVLWILILIHAGAALYHHFIQKDDVLKRMLPEKSKH